MASDLQPPDECSPHGSSSGGGHGWSGGSSSRSNFFGGDSSSGRSPSGASSDAGSGGVTRGGVGPFAPPFGFSGGGLRTAPLPPGHVKRFPFPCPLALQEGELWLLLSQPF